VPCRMDLNRRDLEEIVDVGAGFVCADIIGRVLQAWRDVRDTCSTTCGVNVV